MIETISTSIMNGLLSVIPVKVLMAITIGTPIVIAMLGAIARALLKEEVLAGRLTSQLFFPGPPLQTFRSWLILGRVFTLGILYAATVSFTTKVWITVGLGMGILTSVLLTSCS